jgi:hypothetical protein
MLILDCVSLAAVNRQECALLSYGNARLLALRHSPTIPFADGARRSHTTAQCGRRFLPGRANWAERWRREWDRGALYLQGSSAAASKLRSS